MHRPLPPGPGWQALAEHHDSLRHVSLQELFRLDPERPKRLTIETQTVSLDYSRNLVTDETLDRLTAIAEQAGLAEAIEHLFSGKHVNVSEDRPALHTALRAEPAQCSRDVGADTTAEISTELERIEDFVSRLQAGTMSGFDRQPLRRVINIGIGGSDLGPRLVTDALTGGGNHFIPTGFIANIDPADSAGVLGDSDPATTLFIISSKSFTTLETLENARAARHWLQAAGCPDHALPLHFAAATANPDAAREFGIVPERIFQFRDWVGGRYSLWGAAGMGAACAIGMDRYRQLLAGARSMDRHFRQAPLRANIPVVLALLGVWYNNLYNLGSRAIIPYDYRLRLLPDYLAQLCMESNGKSTGVDGEPIRWDTSPVVWGGAGSNAQHSFMQNLHQGTRIIPVDFLIALQDEHGDQRRHELLLASCLGQARALMSGNHDSESDPHKRHGGNRPSNILFHDRLTPETLGAILAMYEHMVYVQAHLWGINPFDQWGVELGKRMTGQILSALHAETVLPDDSDAATAAMIRRYQERNSS